MEMGLKIVDEADVFSVEINIEKPFRVSRGIEKLFLKGFSIARD
jgi:hypothetical protein